ncbi:MAG: hypothetical protein ACI8Y7_001099 [Candidatus Woesearchaeota archaeon]|jgi:uncharacterized protein (UPF0147 family)
MDDLTNIIQAFEDLKSDSTVPKNTRTKMSVLVGSLKDEKVDIDIRVNKVLDELESIANDANVPSFTKTQVMNIQCLLEML